MDYYGTATGFTDYHTARGRDVSAYTAPQIEIALLVASEWLDGAFRDRWPGFRYEGRTQTRDWPRSWVADTAGYPIEANVVPVEIENATYEMALRHLQDDTALLVDHTPNKYRRVGIDGAVSVEYAALDAHSAQKQFPVLGHILGRLLAANGGSMLSSGITRA